MFPMAKQGLESSLGKQLELSPYDSSDSISSNIEIDHHLFDWDVEKAVDLHIEDRFKKKKRGAFQG